MKQAEIYSAHLIFLFIGLVDCIVLYMSEYYFAEELNIILISKRSKFTT